MLEEKLVVLLASVCIQKVTATALALVDVFNGLWCLVKAQADKIYVEAYQQTKGQHNTMKRGFSREKWKKIEIKEY